MICRQCGAQILRENMRSDGLIQCPGCKKLYRPGKNKARKAAKKKRLILLCAALLASALVVLALCLLPGGKPDREAAPAPSLSPSPTPAASPSPCPVPLEPASVHFRSVGDVMSHRLQLTHALQDNGSYNYDSQFKYVKDALSAADYTIANLELSIAVDDEYSSFPFFRTPEAILAALKSCGVDMLSLANNHILDGFWEGLVHTIDRAEHYGFDHLGADRTPQEAAQPMLKEINGICFGFLAYTSTTNDNDLRLEKDQAAYCIRRLDGADFAADVQQLRNAGAEVVICLPHWGDEGRRSVSPECKEIARQMVDAGVDIILGSHPHVVLPVHAGSMEVKGREKDILIAWSMGNFISFMDAQYMDSGIILDFTVSRDENGGIRIHDVGYVPVYVCGSKQHFHLVCSGDCYDERPSAMSQSDYKRMKQSVREISNMIDGENITMLQH